MQEKHYHTNIQSDSPFGLRSMPAQKPRRYTSTRVPRETEEIRRKRAQAEQRHQELKRLHLPLQVIFALFVIVGVAGFGVLYGHNANATMQQPDVSNQNKPYFEKVEVTNIY